MTNVQTSTLVVKDREGECFLLPLETLERERVPAEHKAEVARVFAEAGGDDVAGYRDSQVPQAATAPRQSQPVCIEFWFGRIVVVDCSPPLIDWYSMP
jgi:hypothetical protein